MPGDRREEHRRGGPRQRADARPRAACSPADLQVLREQEDRAEHAERERQALPLATANAADAEQPQRDERVRRVRGSRRRNAPSSSSAGGDQRADHAGGASSRRRCRGRSPRRARGRRRRRAASAEQVERLAAAVRLGQRAEHAAGWRRAATGTLIQKIACQRDARRRRRRRSPGRARRRGRRRRPRSRSPSRGGRRGTAAASRVSDSGMIAAAPAPWTARAAMSTSALVASADAIEASANTAMPATNTRRRPHRSPSVAAAIMSVAKRERVGVDHPLQLLERGARARSAGRAARVVMTRLSSVAMNIGSGGGDQRDRGARRRAADGTVRRATGTVGRCRHRDGHGSSLLALIDY